MNLDTPNSQANVFDLDTPNGQANDFDLDTPNGQANVFDLDTPKGQANVLDLDTPNGQASVLHLDTPNGQANVFDLDTPNSQANVFDLDTPNSQANVFDLDSPNFLNIFIKPFPNSSNFRSQWPRCQRRRSAGPRLLGLRVRIPQGAWTQISCDCYVLSGRGLCYGTDPPSRRVLLIVIYL